MFTSVCLTHSDVVVHGTPTVMLLFVVHGSPIVMLLLVVVHGSPMVMLLLVVVHGSPIVMLLLVVAAVNHLLTLVEEDEDLSPELYEPGLSAFAELLLEEDKMNVCVALADGLVLVV